MASNVHVKRQRETDKSAAGPWYDGHPCFASEPSIFQCRGYSCARIEGGPRRGLAAHTTPRSAAACYSFAH